ncbi:unnamed protein product [Schistosoma turkestanicum]|nr:unnamed protein product [Schistosoma turkestanicum]
MVTRTYLHINNNSYTYQQPISYTFTPDLRNFQRPWKSYQNLHGSHLLNRHVSDQHIAIPTTLRFNNDSCKSVKQCCNVTFTINNTTNHNTSNHCNSNYSINSTNNNTVQQNFHKPPSNIHYNINNSNSVFKENSSTRMLGGKLRSSSLPPILPTRNYFTPQKSIIAHTGNTTPQLVNQTCHTFSSASACQHDGADWEDCRISIDCFGIRGKHCKSIRHLHKNHNNQLVSQSHLSSTLAGNTWNGLNTKYLFPLSIKPPSIQLEGKHLNKTSQSIRPHSLCARSVRLSIIPLNPIYKRSPSLLRRKQCFPNHNNPSIRSQSTRNTSWNNSFDLRHCRTVFRNCWRKNLIQRMAFKIDDFTIQEDQVKVAKDVFKRFDKRGQEKISTTDLGPAFRALNLTVKPDTLKEWADQVDDDATGFIDFNGFLICYGKKLQEDQDERDLRDAFRVLDKNKRGEIDVEDLRWILKGLGDDLTEEEIDDMIRDTDTDGSGFVDFDEFYKLMTSE